MSIDYYQLRALAFEEEDERDCHSSSSPTLPYDMLYEILTRVKLDDLLRRCRWVCRDWNALTYNPTFKRYHRQRTQSVSGFLIQNLKNHRHHTSFLSIEASPSSISLDFMPATSIKIEAVSYQAQGLVCCTSNEYYHAQPGYYICKPATQQWTRIPNPKTGYQTRTMAIVVKNSHPLHYKIVRFSLSKKDFGLYCEIFDSNIWAWRLCLKNPKLPDFVLKPGQVLVHGSLHWLSFNNHIFAFDIDKEIWRLTSLPQAKSFEEGKEPECMNSDFRIQKRLVNCEGHIGLIYTTWSWIELWVMENYLEETWKKRYSLSLEPLNQIVGMGYSLLAMESMDTMLVMSFDKLIWYNCTSGVPTQVMKIENPALPIDACVHPLNSDSEPCNLGLREYPKENSRSRPRVHLKEKYRTGSSKK